MCLRNLTQNLHAICGRDVAGRAENNYYCPGSIFGRYKKKVVGLERGPLSLMSTTEELLDRKVAAPV
jgi:hypothetical protein